LRDQFITIEGMTRGEYKAGAAGVVLRYGCDPTTLGLATIVCTGRGICRLAFLDDSAVDFVALLRRGPKFRSGADLFGSNQLGIVRCSSAAFHLSGER